MFGTDIFTNPLESILLIINIAFLIVIGIIFYWLRDSSRNPDKTKLLNIPAENKNTEQAQKRDWAGLFLQIIPIVCFFIFVIYFFSIWIDYSRIHIQTSDRGASASDALDRANDAIASAELLLSFFEGAAVLVGLGFGALTYYGMRNARETQEKLEEKEGEIQSMLDKIQKREADLDKLGELQNNLKQSQKSMLRTIDNVARVLQADQEFRLNNPDTSYAFACQVLSNDSDNWLALYIAGWLEVHHMDKLEKGIEHLEQAMKAESDWPTAQAAYGVALRRKARKMKEINDPEYEKIFTQAEGNLLAALGHTPRLLDFNGESFWGSVGGIRMEANRLSGALEAYENALEITPESSYPLGNAATLRLQKAQKSKSDDDIEQALETFKRTVEVADRERFLNPNDYYLWMDTAQSKTILIMKGQKHLKEAEDAFQKALNTKPSVGAMETSLRGWQSLIDYCPDNNGWDVVKKHLLDFKTKLKEQIKNTSGTD